MADNLVIPHARVREHEHTVFDMVGAGIQRALDRLDRQAVARSALADLVCLVDRCAHLVSFEGWKLGVRSNSASPGGHNLDEVRALLEQLTRRSAHLVRTVGLAPKVVAVPPSDRQGTPAKDEPGPGHDTSPDRVSNAKHDLTATATVPNRRHPRVECNQGVGVRLEHQNFVGQLHPFRERSPVARQRCMGVHVDQSGQDSVRAEIKYREATRYPASFVDAGNNAVLDDQPNVPTRLRAGAVNQLPH